MFHSIKVKDIQKEMGRTLREYRKREQLTQEELAKRLNLSRITIQNLERGNNFTADTFLKVMQYFGLLQTMSEFLKSLQIENVKSLY